MNGKQAKRLRSRAHAVTIGRPWLAYQQTNRSGTIALQPGCGRKFYQQRKRAFRRGGGYA